MSQTFYTCPGEKYPISRSVHLSRLAAFYPKCRDCEHRNDTGQLTQHTVDRLQSTERRVERESLLTDEGIRGVYLNELTRGKAGAYAAAFAGLLWEATPLIGRSGSIGSGESANRGPKRIGPAVVVGYDERPSSPDIVTGVTSMLRRFGCQVIDIGLSTKPCFAFAVDHLQASGGIFVTGSGCEPSWTGLDVVADKVRPLSRSAGLDDVEARLRAGQMRPTRQAGTRRSFQAMVPYGAGLWKHFHALRPLHVCLGCPVRSVRSTLSRLFEKLPCRLSLIDIPDRARDVRNPDDTDVARIAAAVRTERAHLGVIIDDDGARCGFVDETGALVPAANVTRMIAEFLLAGQPGGTAVLESAAFPEFAEPAASSISDTASEPTTSRKSATGNYVDGGRSFAALWRSMREHEAGFCGGNSGRFWFGEAYPSCDAILTVAKVLQALSRSDAAFSSVAGTGNASRS